MSAKRTSLQEAMSDPDKLREEADQLPDVLKNNRKPSKKSPHTNTVEGHRTMGIRLSLEDHALLHEVAHRRAIKEGGRSNMSGIIAELIEAHRAELEAELKS